MLVQGLFPMTSQNGMTMVSQEVKKHEATGGTQTGTVWLTYLPTLKNDFPNSKLKTRGLVHFVRLDKMSQYF